MSSQPWNLGSEKSNATLQLRQDYIYDALNEHLIGSGIVDATTFAALASYLGYSSGGAGQDMQVAWTPTNLKLGELTGFTSFNGGGQGITSVTFQASTSVDGFDIELWNNLTSISFPNLATIDPAGISGALVLILLPLVTSVNCPLLTKVGGGVSIQQMAGLTSASFPLLTDTANIHFDQCPLLTTINVSSWVPTNGSNNLFTACALNAATVNSILARGVANAGFVSGLIDTSGGTSLGPSGQGILDKATLNARQPGLAVTN